MASRKTFRWSQYPCAAAAGTASGGRSSTATPDNDAELFGVLATWTSNIAVEAELI
jgi:hypothetical protein